MSAVCYKRWTLISLCPLYCWLVPSTFTEKPRCYATFLGGLDDGVAEDFQRSRLDRISRPVLPVLYCGVVIVGKGGAITILPL